MADHISSLAARIHDLPLADEDSPDGDKPANEGGLALNGNTTSPAEPPIIATEESHFGSNLDQELSSDEAEEKSRLISQVLELQNTLDDLSHRVDTVKEENLKLKSENQVLGQYIENLMAASSVFQSTVANGKKKGNSTKGKK